MADREQLELLASRLLDGDLSPGERELLDGAMAADPALRAFAAQLDRVHNSVNLLAGQRLPQDFASRVLQGIEVEAEAPVIQLTAWTHWAAAAAVMLTLGLLVGAAIINNNGRPADVDPVAIRLPGGTIVTPTDIIRGPSASVVAFSQGELEVVSQQGREVTSRYEGELSLPAEVSAPADTYAVVEVKGGTAVLSPGARARLSDVDADGMPDFEPIDGDLYLEGGVQSRVGAINLDTQGGVTLRHTSEGYRAEPSHGITRAGELNIGHRQWARLYGDMQVSDREEAALDDWAIRGRADAIKLELRKLLGADFDKIPARHWQQFDKLLCGVLSRPWERATYAYMVRFLLKYDFLADTTAEERQAWASIAAILAEGTTEEDVPVRIRDLFARAEEGFKQNPQQLEDFKAMLRDSMERAGERD